MLQEKGNVSINTENIFPIIKKWLYSEKDILGETIFYGIKDNMVVSFKEVGTRQAMIYENAPIAKLQKEEEDSKNIEKYKKSVSEF